MNESEQKWRDVIAKVQHKSRVAKLRAKASPIPRSTMSIEQAMGYTGLGRTTIYRLMDEGAMETIKIGRRRLIKIESIKKLMGDDA